MHRALLLTPAAAATLLGASPALAQDAPEAQTAFDQFFLSTDPLGMTIIWTLVLLSALSIGFIIKLMLQHRRSSIVPPATREQIQELIAEKKYRDAIELAKSDDSYFGRLTSSALLEAANGFPAMERAIAEASDAETTRYLRPVEYLNVVGNIAPMIGLFGTVYGMIRAFQTLVELGGQPDPTQLAAGISTALVTTLWGLIVAIPALAGYALVRNKIDALTSEGLLEAEAVIANFKPGRKSGSGGSGSAPRAKPSVEDSDAKE